MIVGCTPLSISPSAFSSRAPARMTAEVVPSPTSLSVAFETSTSIFAAGCCTSISLSMVAPSLVMVTSPIESTSILSMPRGPIEVLTISAISFAAWMLFLWASLPLDWLLPSLRMRTGVPPEVTAGIAVVDIFSYNTTPTIQLRVVYKKFGCPQEGTDRGAQPRRSAVWLALGRPGVLLAEALLVLSGELDVQRGDAAFVVRLDLKVYGGPDYVDVRMMPEVFRDEGHLVHEGYAVHELLELEGLCDEISIPLPTGEGLQPRLDLSGAQSSQRRGFQAPTLKPIGLGGICFLLF